MAGGAVEAISSEKQCTASGALGVAGRPYLPLFRTACPEADVVVDSGPDFAVVLVVTGGLVALAARAYPNLIQ